MKISVEHPFSLQWRIAYLRISKDGRKRVDLFNSNKDRTTISYARYLLSVKEGRVLSEDEEADHKDGDRSNDHTDNLQILVKPKHKKKTKIEKGGVKTLCLTCASCSSVFLRRDDSKRPKQTFCSRTCYYNSLRHISVV